MPHSWEYGWTWGMSMGVGMLIFWVLVIVAMVYLIRYLARGMGGRNIREETALDILKKRYARGEISREQYEQMREDLKK